MEIGRIKKIRAEIVELLGARNRLRHEKYAEKCKREKELLEELEELDKEKRLEIIKTVIAERVRDIRKRNELSQEKICG